MSNSPSRWQRAAAMWRPARAAWSRFMARPSIRGLYDSVASTFSGMFGSAYEVLDPARRVLNRGVGWFLRSFSANELAAMSVAQLRALSRKLERDNPTARAARDAYVAQVVGTGIALEPDTGNPADDVKLRAVWLEYIEACDISGKLSLYDLESIACADEFIAGEYLWRLVIDESRLKTGECPLVVLPLECEWLSSDPPVVDDNTMTSVPGIKLDRYGRPIAYRLRNPEWAQQQAEEEVQAAAIIHGFERRRGVQNRGEPMLAPVIERIYQEGDLVSAELKSAINCAAMSLVIESKTQSNLDTSTFGTSDDPAQQIPVGGIFRAFPGEEVKAFSHNRPAQQIADFRRTIRGDIGAATKTSQRWLDRDYSKANYSSMRADMLDTERLITPVRERFGHGTAGELFMRALPFLCVLAGIKQPKKRRPYRLVPDATPYVDPEKDVKAAILAIANGLSTWEIEIGKRGGDSKKMLAALQKELDDNPLAAGIFLANQKNSASPAVDGGEPADDTTGDAAAAPRDGEPLKAVSK